jgi:hypothetical protein
MRRRRRRSNRERCASFLSAPYTGYLDHGFAGNDQLKADAM